MIFVRKKNDRFIKKMKILLIIIGIVGLLLPILPGIALILLGMFLFKNKKIIKYFKNFI